MEAARTSTAKKSLSKGRARIFLERAQEWYRVGCELAAKGGLVDLIPILLAGQKKEPRDSGALQTQKLPSFALLRLLLGVPVGVHRRELLPLSGRSSNDENRGHGQTGTQAPQSIHSTGLIYNIVSLWWVGSSLRGWMQSTGHTSTHAVSLVLMQGSAIT